MIERILRSAAAVLAIVVAMVAILLALWIIIWRESFTDLTLVTINTALGALLVCTGLALAALGFLIGTFARPDTAGPKEEGVFDPAATIEALTKLLQQAGGLGIAVMLFGVILLTGTALGTSDDTTPSSGTSPTATATAAVR